MAQTNQNPGGGISRKKLIIILAVPSLLLFAVLFSLSSSYLRFIQPKTSGETVTLVSLTILVPLLFAALTFVLFRNLFTLFAHRRLPLLSSTSLHRLLLASFFL